jgi:hypothetical protein
MQKIAAGESRGKKECNHIVLKVATGASPWKKELRT